MTFFLLFMSKYNDKRKSLIYSTVEYSYQTRTKTYLSSMAGQRFVLNSDKFIVFYQPQTLCLRTSL